MSFRALFAAWSVQTRTANGWAVLMALAGHHNDETELCCPSQTTLAARTNLSVDTVGRAVKDLEAEGLIKRHVRRRPDTGARISDRYELLFASPRQLILLLEKQALTYDPDPLTRNLQGGDLALLAGSDPNPQGAEGGLTRTQRGAPPQAADETSKITGKGSSGAKTPDATTAQVDAIWAAIPTQRATKAEPNLPDVRKRSESKGEVAKALTARLRDGHPFDRVLAGVVAYYADPDITKAGPNGPYQYAQGCQRVLRKGLWETYLPPEEEADEDMFGARHDPGAVRSSPAVDLVADWQGAVWLDEWLENPGSWRGERGPQPGHQGCRVNPDLLTAKGITPWTP